MANHLLDKTDQQILDTLQQNGRITNLQLSNEIGLSPAPTLERVKKLERLGIIKSYHAKLDMDELGLGIHTFMQVSLLRHKQNAMQSFIERVNEIDEIVECYHITGGSDYLLKIIVKDMRAYERLVMDKLSTIEEIGQMQTMMVLSTIKQSDKLPISDL
jgi:Lrp/AsnC family transcriptional regulator, leucine-responsive regulatory protein